MKKSHTVSKDTTSIVMTPDRVSKNGIVISAQKK